MGMARGRMAARAGTVVVNKEGTMPLQDRARKDMVMIVDGGESMQCWKKMCLLRLLMKCDCQFPSQGTFSLSDTMNSLSANETSGLAEEYRFNGVDENLISYLKCSI